MTRVRRVGMGSLGLGLLFVLLNGLRSASSQQPSAAEMKAEVLDPGAAAQTHREPAEAPNPDADIARFIGLLGQLRSNDESVVPEMRELAEKLCRVHDRCDAKDILAYYLAVPPEARAKGAEESAKVNEIWSATRELREQLEAGSPVPDWDRTRDETIARLREIADRSLREPDAFPGANSLSCVAFLETDRLQHDASISESDRTELLGTALDDAQRSIEAYGKCGMVGPRVQPLGLIANLHAEAGEDRVAYLEFRECLALARRVRQTLWQEKCYEGMLRLASRAGDLRERSDLLGELASIQNPDESWVLARGQALLLLDQDLGAAAAEFLQEHSPIEVVHKREWQILRGDACLRKGDLEGARAAYAIAEPLPWGLVVRQGMALIDIRAGNADRAVEQLSRPDFVDDPHPVTRATTLQIIGEALVRLHRYEEATQTLERALGIAGRLQARFERERSLLGAATSVIGESVGVHAVALLAEAQVRSGHPLEAARSIENWQSRTLRGATRSVEDISSDDLVSWAKNAGAGLVTWVVGAESSVVVFVGPDGVAEGACIARGRRAIEAAVRRLNDAVRGGNSAQAERLAAEVGSCVLPSEIARRVRDIRTGASSRVLFLVHGPIERLSIEYLFRDEGLVPVILPGLPEPRPGDAVTPNDLTSWNLLGSPVDSEGHALLPGAKEELTTIAALHGGKAIPSGIGQVQAASFEDAGIQVMTGSAFDRAALAAALEGQRPLHVATHLSHGCGRREDRIADVGLELSAGASFCAREILDAKPRLPLAVLDACETADGRFVDAEGLQGVSRAFLESGTRNLLVTAWPVEDQAARAFAEEFHRELLSAKRPSEAASTARNHLRARGFPAADWAAFRFVGRD
jgi:tetratricopeptide (TPR) repeat protein